MKKTFLERLFIHFQSIYEIITNIETLMLSRKSPRYFTRKRKLSFEDLLYCILLSSKNTTATMLRAFWTKFKKEGTRMSHQAYSKARNHFDHTPFEKMFCKNVAETYENSKQHGLMTHKGYIVVAFDGSYYDLPDSKELLDSFGGMGGNCDSPTALVEVAYDVLNKVVISGSINSSKAQERSCAIELFPKIKAIVSEPVIMLFDRGYPSREFIKNLPKDTKYVMRVKSGFSVDIDKATEKDSIITLANTDIRVRVIQITLDNGKKETLITNETELSYEDFKSLYAMRWGIETEYDILKSILEVENFTGRSKNTILQDFWASMVMINLVGDAIADGNKKLEKLKSKKGNKNEQQVNVSHLVGCLKDDLIELTFAPPNKQLRLLIKLEKEILRETSQKRNGRSFPRKTPRAVKYCYNHKSNA
jgi:hypothetical protein